MVKHFPPEKIVHIYNIYILAIQLLKIMPKMLDLEGIGIVFNMCIQETKAQICLYNYSTANRGLCFEAHCMFLSLA